MLVVGAGGLAKEVLEIFHSGNLLEGLYFYDGISPDPPKLLYNQFIVYSQLEDIRHLFTINNQFVIAVGKPAFRADLFQKFIEMGGQPVSAISEYAHIGHYGTNIGAGSIVMAGTVITNNITIGISCLINPNCTISHDTHIGNFVEISPGVKITGNCKIGDMVSIGTGAVLLPGVSVGNSAIIGAGAVITKDVMQGTTVVGIPAKPLNK
jgi:sugar O-acyltransferase (sialic acid O-acetyltransferase NeuD family)